MVGSSFNFFSSVYEYFFVLLTHGFKFKMQSHKLKNRSQRIIRGLKRGEIICDAFLAENFRTGLFFDRSPPIMCETIPPCLPPMVVSRPKGRPKTIHPGTDISRNYAIFWASCFVNCTLSPMHDHPWIYARNLGSNGTHVAQKN